MINSKKNKILSLKEFKLFCSGLKPHAFGAGLLVLSLIILSLAVGMQLEDEGKLFVEGELATIDVAAPRNVRIEDAYATNARRELVAMSQPMVFDLSAEPAAEVRNRIFAVMNKLATSEHDIASDLNINQFNNLLDQLELSGESASVLSAPNVQGFIVEDLIPWLDEKLRDGVVSDSRLLHSASNGIVVRNLDTAQETIYLEDVEFIDIQTLFNSLLRFLQVNSDLGPFERRTIFQLVASVILPTITLNREATQAKGLEASENVEPIVYQISRGEIIVHAGDIVSREQQLKLQLLYKQGKTFFRAPETIGTFLISLFFAIGLFVAPSGRAGHKIRRVDLFFTSFLLLLFGAIAKAMYILLPELLNGAYSHVLLYVFPSGAISGLGALVFAARRYCSTGLLAALFTTLLLNGSLALFVFYFISAMIYTWLILKAQTRQDVVSIILPYFLMVLPLGFGCAMLDGVGTQDTASLFFSLMANAILTFVFLFSFSPVLEYVFGYTTRFKLMELLNLEQPLLQELMITVPGTYHHCLIVSNMVEAGAKAIGANSLLCRVGALYHDIGKLSYPEYFIENQQGGPNKHDKLAPNMSALILISHVKKGGELAAEHKLGEDIEDIIRQHHGTSLMKFFYAKAVEQNGAENISVEEFSYPGPRPQTREAAIVMLADVIEASTRSMSDPTPARIKTHIDTIIKDIFAEGQLDESELTFQDLHKLSDNFARILTGLFHQRIAYPDVAKIKSEAKSSGEQTNKIEESVDSA